MYKMRRFYAYACYAQNVHNLTPYLETKCNVRGEVELFYHFGNLKITIYWNIWDEKKELCGLEKRPKLSDKL